ncbi:MAG: hypothetical protein R3C15_16835 [Thermoleophilia bacterium]
MDNPFEQPPRPTSEPPVPSAWRPEPRRRRRWRRGLLWLLALVLLVVVFVAGLALGKALEDAPVPGGTQTLVRTLDPETIGPARVVTVRRDGR